MFVAAPVAGAETGTKALILGSSVSGGVTSIEATRAAANGFAVTIVDDPTWGAMTAAQFADYQMIVVGDPSCGSLSRVVSQNATALADAVMNRTGINTKVGNRMLVGTDPALHDTAGLDAQGGKRLIETGIDFIGIEDGATNLYLTFTCGDPDYDVNTIPDGQDKLLPLLTADPNTKWTQNENPPCGGSASLISNAAQFATLKSGHLQNWGCSVHETFPTFPTDWTALAIATDTTTKPTCGTDVDTGAAVCGEAHVLISGSRIVVTAPNLSLSPTSASNSLGSSHTVTATATNPDRTTPRPGVPVSFVITGVNSGAQFRCAPVDCTTDAAGQVALTYTGTRLGDDTINASITVDGSRQTATANSTWVPDTAPPQTIITNGPAGTVAGNTATFEFSSTKAGTRFECRLDGGPFVPCSSPFTTGPLAPGPHTFEVRSIDAAGNVSPPVSRSFTIVADADRDGVPDATDNCPAVANADQADADRDAIGNLCDTSDASLPPRVGRNVIVRVVSGEVFFRPPGARRSRAKTARGAQSPAGFRPVKGAEVIPVNSEVHALRGRLALTSVERATAAGRTLKTQKADFYQGIFQVRQARARRPVTDIKLRSPSFAKTCGPSSRAAGDSAADPVGTAAQKRRSKKVASQLWGNGRGNFRTVGRHSAATVRGTIWLTQERCDGTLTRVRRGVVSVFDLRANRTVRVRAGQSYLARAVRAAIKTRRG